MVTYFFHTYTGQAYSLLWCWGCLSIGRKEGEEGTTAPNRASFWAEEESALKPGQEARRGTTNNSPEAKCLFLHQRPRIFRKHH